MGRVKVLMSGGWDSVVCLLSALKVEHAPSLYFFDYGQPYVERERAAVAYVEEKSGLRAVRMEVPRLVLVGDVFDSRNERMIRAISDPGDTVYFGCRNVLNVFDKYGDSNLQFARELASRLAIDIRTPCVALPKWVIRRRILRAGYDLSRLYSTDPSAHQE